MITETFTFKAGDGKDIFTYKWSPVGIGIRGIVQISHGLSEHAGRYIHFARDLAASGYMVYANDHRGHGRTAKNFDNLVYIEEGEWNKIVEDIASLTNIINQNYPNLPVFLFGHSMGSFILRHNLYQNPAHIKLYE